MDPDGEVLVLCNCFLCSIVYRHVFCFWTWAFLWWIPKFLQLETNCCKKRFINSTQVQNALQ